MIQLPFLGRKLFTVANYIKKENTMNFIPERDLFKILDLIIAKYEVHSVRGFSQQSYIVNYNMRKRKRESKNLYSAFRDAIKYVDYKTPSEFFKMYNYDTNYCHIEFMLEPNIYLYFIVLMTKGNLFNVTMSIRNIFYSSTVYVNSTSPEYLVRKIPDLEFYIDNVIDMINGGCYFFRKEDILKRELMTLATLNIQ